MLFISMCICIHPISAIIGHYRTSWAWAFTFSWILPRVITRVIRNSIGRMKARLQDLIKICWKAHRDMICSPFIRLMAFHRDFFCPWWVIWLDQFCHRIHCNLRLPYYHEKNRRGIQIWTLPIGFTRRVVESMWGSSDCSTREKLHECMGRKMTLWQSCLKARPGRASLESFEQRSPRYFRKQPAAIRFDTGNCWPPMGDYKKLRCHVNQKTLLETISRRMRRLEGEAHDTWEYSGKKKVSKYSKYGNPDKKRDTSRTSHRVDCIFITRQYPGLAQSILCPCPRVAVITIICCPRFEEDIYAKSQQYNIRIIKWTTYVYDILK